jgi:hypothetical protein
MDGNAAVLQPGDLVIYRGCDLEHWREPFNINDENAWHVQGFFHYVDKNGPYKHYKYDQRTSLGLLKDQEQAPITKKKDYIIYV